MSGQAYPYASLHNASFLRNDLLTPATHYYGDGPKVICGERLIRFAKRPGDDRSHRRDGISTESILAQALSREGIPVSSVFVRQLEPMAMRHIPKDDSLKLFTDLGAGQQNLLEEHGLSADEVLILDHHVSQPCGTAYPQVNCLDYGVTRMSAAGVAYLVAKTIDPTSTDLAKLAVVGNVGDMMARENCGLVGPAREIVQDGVEYGNIIVGTDLNCYGISTRPVHVCPATVTTPTSTDPNSTNAALQFLKARC